MPQNRWLVGYYGAAVFVAAVLLFSVQPLIVKMVLPSLGGTPAVWNVSQVFFQLLLLVGYLYAHFLARMRSIRVAIAIHGALLLFAFALLPLALPAQWHPPASGSPVASLLGVLAMTVGVPFFAVAATAPLMQVWFSRSGHSAGSDPYFLYSASNLGGLLALAAYPFVLEPLLGLRAQSLSWSVGLVLLALIIALAVWCSSPMRAPATTHSSVQGAHRARPSFSTRLRWLALAFAPASLMLGVTLHISTDIAAAPFLWLPPLALYLLTWAITFARKPILSHRSMLMLQAPVLAALVVFFDVERLAPAFILHGLAFFVTAMVCHGELARTRPPVTQLTEFYLWVSMGGVLGGAFTGLLAPVIFDSVLEYPIALVLACALRPVFGAKRSRANWRDGALPVGLALLYLFARWQIGSIDYAATELSYLVVAILVAALLWAMRLHVTRFAVAVALILLVLQTDTTRRDILVQQRSFYGVHRVITDDGDRYHVLTHGGTVHGAQRFDSTRSLEPLTYYTREGPAGQVFSVLHKLKPNASVTVAGLGSGALSCLNPGAPGIRYLEIDPVVVQVARDSRYLTYLSGCGAKDSVVQGDARRSLTAIEDDSTDLLVLDAFSSDSVPAHLLTVTAMDLYVRKLAPGGVLLLHLSNRNLDLNAVAAATANAAGLVTRIQQHQPDLTAESARYRWTSTWMLAARSRDALAPFLGTGDWQAPNTDAKPWTDDYSNIAGAVRWDRFW